MLFPPLIFLQHLIGLANLKNLGQGFWQELVTFSKFYMMMMKKSIMAYQMSKGYYFLSNPENVTSVLY